jgi:glycosyltransferase involved in cell wall biosynthesis
LESAEEYQCIVFGEDDTTITDSDLPVKSVGYLPEEKLIQLYSECDVMVVPSRYESFGQTAAESLACGTPVVAFDATGPSDIVDHKRTGYLAAPYDPADLASGIEYVLADPDRCRRLGEEARAKALREYNSEVVVKEYKDLYKSLLQSHSES